MELSDASDDQLWRVCRKLPSDFEPFGERKRERGQPDCSTCRWFQPLLRPGQLDWGTCANPVSPRGGLLTFREQGCEHFEEQEEPGLEDTRIRRSDFKNAIENILVEALGDYADLKTAKANDPVDLGIANKGYDPLPPKYDYWVWYWENKLDRLIELLLGIYLEKHADFDRRKATEEVISDIKQDTGKYWRLAPKSVARAIKCDIVALRVPDAPNREDEFWSRVTDAINEALR
jgi:hypothetical protein